MRLMAMRPTYPSQHVGQVTALVPYRKSMLEIDQRPKDTATLPARRKHLLNCKLELLQVPRRSTGVNRSRWRSEGIVTEIDVEVYRRNASLVPSVDVWQEKRSSGIAGMESF